MLKCLPQLGTVDFLLSDSTWPGQVEVVLGPHFHLQLQGPWDPSWWRLGWSLIAKGDADIGKLYSKIQKWRGRTAFEARQSLEETADYQLHSRDRLKEVLNWKWLASRALWWSPGETHKTTTCFTKLICVTKAKDVKMHRSEFPSKQPAKRCEPHTQSTGVHGESVKIHATCCSKQVKQWQQIAVLSKPGRQLFLYL